MFSLLILKCMLSLLAFSLHKYFKNAIWQQLLQLLAKKSQVSCKKTQSSTIKFVQDLIKIDFWSGDKILQWHTVPAARLKVLPFMELWTGENQFNIEPTRGSCLSNPCRTQRKSNIWKNSFCSHIAHIDVYTYPKPSQIKDKTYIPLQWVSPHWPFATAALPPGCLSSPPRSCSLIATQERITITITF